MGKTTPKVPFFKDSGRCPKILDYTMTIELAQHRAVNALKLALVEDLCFLLRKQNLALYTPRKFRTCFLYRSRNINYLTKIGVVISQRILVSQIIRAIINV